MSIDIDWRDREQYVYVYWADDVCLYVGVTSDPKTRIATHRRSAHAEAATHVDLWSIGNDRSEAERVEKAVIRDLDPLWNTTHSPRRFRDHMAWIAYSEWRSAVQDSYSDLNLWWVREADHAGPICAAVGYDHEAVLASMDAEQRERREAMVRAVYAVAADIGTR